MAHGSIGLSKVRRYWPGKAPDWCEGAAAADEEVDDLRTACLSLENKGLRCLTVAKNQLEERIMDHRLVRRPEVVSTVVQESETEEDEEKRRMRTREMRLLLGEEEELLPHEEAEAEAEEESEYETESEDEHQLDITAMVKPALFVPKPERVTIAERHRLVEWGRRLEELAKKRLEVRRVETRQIVVEEIRKEGQIDKMTLNDEDGVDTDDGLDEAGEYESWKHREIARIKRARDGEAEIKKMSILSMECELTKLDPLARPKKRQRRFLQKYYHKGSFFQEDADDTRQPTCKFDNYTRDFSAPTGEDKMDKSILPKVMQVKNFGRSGRTKWTYLVNEDTTYRNTPCISSSVAC